MAVNCIFTRSLPRESYMKHTEEEILSSLEESVVHFIEMCDGVSVESVGEQKFIKTAGAVPQPHIEVLVSCDGDPQNHLIKKQVSIIGDIEFFDEELLPIKLLGPKYWVSDSFERSVETIQEERQQEEKEQSSVDSFIDRLFHMFR